MKYTYWTYVILINGELQRGNFKVLLQLTVSKEEAKQVLISNMGDIEIVVLKRTTKKNYVNNQI